MPQPQPLQAKSGQLSEVNNEAGPTSYTTGGFSIRTGLNRVDNAIVQGSDGTYEMRESVSDHNAIVVTAHSQASGGELPAGTDLSSVTVTYAAYME